MIKLSNRLLAVAGLVTPGNKVADVGTDHGYIPIYLIENGICEKAVAMDVNVGPLKRAEEHIKEHELGNYISTRLSDGVLALKQNEVDSVVIAGMGGGLVMKILTEGRDILSSVKELILQPQSDVDKVRHFLFENGYHITSEDMVLEDGKYYPMMRVEHGKNNIKYPERYYLYGGILIQDKHPVLISYIEKEEKQLLKIQKQIKSECQDNEPKGRMLEIAEKLERIKETREEMGLSCSAQIS